jgi:phosphopantothenate synthetase
MDLKDAVTGEINISMFTRKEKKNEIMTKTLTESSSQEFALLDPISHKDLN